MRDIRSRQACLMRRQYNREGGGGWSRAMLGVQGDSMSDSAATALVIAVIVAAGLSAVALIGRVLHRRSWRQRAWAATGVILIPMAAVSSAYLVGLPYVMTIALVSAVLARWRRLDHLVAIATLPLLALLIGAAAADGFDLFAMALWVSGYGMTIGAAKLGRLAGRAWIWRDIVRSAGATQASLP
jgi:hypothetical protein